MLLNICVLISIILSFAVIIGAFLHRDIFIKLLFVNTGTNLVSLFICFLSSYKVNNSYIDIAMIYFLLSIVATNAFLKYFLQKHKATK